MANISVTYGDLLDASARLTAGKEDLLARLQELLATIGGLVSGGFVTDAASGAFHSAYEQFTAGATQTVSALDGLAGFLAQAASVLEGVDRDLGAAIRG
ncbi:MAG: type VII secretion protein [Micrococcales bacterium 73-13]|nr:MAG: type VII secretion protein [Micrococcales bacterium 73-13]